MVSAPRARRPARALRPNHPKLGADKPTELADYSVCTTWGVKGPQFYLLNVLRKKLAYFDLKRAVHDQHLLFNPSVVLIEDKASGTQLIQELIEAGLSKVTRYKPDGDKIMRLHAQTATIENGFVHLPREAHWLADYLHELTVFPNGRYDDQVDSTSQALAWTKQRPPGWAFSNTTDNWPTSRPAASNHCASSCERRRASRMSIR